MRLASAVLFMTMIGLAACGGGGSIDASKPHTAVDTYQVAILDGNAETACEALTGEASREIISDASDLAEDTASCSAPN